MLLVHQCKGITKLLHIHPVSLVESSLVKLQQKGNYIFIHGPIIQPAIYACAKASKLLWPAIRHTVDGRNPKQPPGMYKNPLNNGKKNSHINWLPSQSLTARP